MLDLNQIIDDRVQALDEAKRAAHEPSGKLSAGMLSWPIQWSVLKLIGVDDVPPDTYALRKFARGNQVEDWLIDMVVTKENGYETQKEVEYRGTIGYVDLAIDSEPHEIKSVTNMKFKRITQGAWVDQPDRKGHRLPDGPQYGHKLQVGLYALAMGSDHGYLHYVASDDLRLASFVIDTEDVKKDIDDTINEVNLSLTTGEVPMFGQREAWHNMPEYAKYYDWQQLSPPELEAKLKSEYPDAYAKLKAWGNPK